MRGVGCLADGFAHFPAEVLVNDVESDSIAIGRRIQNRPQGLSNATLATNDSPSIAIGGFEFEQITILFDGDVDFFWLADDRLGQEFDQVCGVVTFFCGAIGVVERVVISGH